MKKTIFVLLMGLQCIAPHLTPGAHQIVEGVDTKTVKISGEISSAAPNQGVLLTSAVLSSNSTASKQAQVMKNQQLKGYTTGSEQIDDLIIASAVGNQLDPVLLYLIMHRESSFNPRAVSRKGARGLMQLIPATAARFGVRNIFDPQQNIEGGARYLRLLLDTFEGEVSLALAAYNAGEGNVEKYNRHVPPFSETVRYVSEITQCYEATNSALLQTAD
jgi:soluble lytic murein transglycosylase-like protein